LATALASAAVVSAAPSDSEQVARVVRFSDLDVHTASGAVRAAFRIRQAATFVCGGVTPFTQGAADFIACRNDAVDRALAQLNAPMVSAALGRPTSSSLAQR
jgi:UrcA family protein